MRTYHETSHIVTSFPLSLHQIPSPCSPARRAPRYGSQSGSCAPRWISLIRASMPACSRGTASISVRGNGRSAATRLRRRARIASMDRRSAAHSPSGPSRRRSPRGGGAQFSGDMPRHITRPERPALGSRPLSADCITAPQIPFCACTPALRTVPLNPLDKDENSSGSGWLIYVSLIFPG